MPSETSDQTTARPAATSATLVSAQNSIAAPADAAAPVSDDAKRTGWRDEPTNSRGMLIVYSLILVFGLVLFSVIWRVTRKYIAASWGRLIPVLKLALVVTRKYIVAGWGRLIPVFEFALVVIGNIPLQVGAI